MFMDVAMIYAGDGGLVVVCLGEMLVWVYCAWLGREYIVCVNIRVNYCG